MPKVKDLQTPFKDYIAPLPNMSGDGVAVRDGLDIPGGQKGTPGKMPEVTTVSIPSGKGVGEKVGTGDVIGTIARKKVGFFTPGR